MEATVGTSDGGPGLGLPRGNLLRGEAQVDGAYHPYLRHLAA